MLHCVEMSASPAAVKIVTKSNRVSPRVCGLREFIACVPVTDIIAFLRKNSFASWENLTGRGSMIYANIRDPGFALVLLPDTNEFVQFNDAEFSYSGGYSEYEAERHKLHSDIVAAWYADSSPDKIDEIRLSLPDAPRVHGWLPEFTWELSVALSGGAVGAGLYNLLALWVKKSNGRKLRVRLPSGFEIEATQMKRKEFETLFTKLHEIYESDNPAPIEVSYSREMSQLEELLDQAVQPGRLISRNDAEIEKKRLKDAYILNREKIRRNLESDSS